MQPNIKVKLDEVIMKTVITTSKRIIDEYKECIASLIEIDDYDFSKDIKVSEIFTRSIGNTESIVNDYIEVKKEISGYEEIWIGEWYLPWTWFDTAKIPIYKDVEEVDLVKFFMESIGSLNIEFEKSSEKAKEKAMEEASKFREYFIKEMDKLDNIVKNKIDELQKISSNKDKTEEEKNNNEKNKYWLEDFVKKLDNILEI